MNISTKNLSYAIFNQQAFLPKDGYKRRFLFMQKGQQEKKFQGVFSLQASLSFQTAWFHNRMFYIRLQNMVQYNFPSCLSKEYT
jgi:hypothetical protein